jgi:hypothetical protein
MRNKMSVVTEFLNEHSLDLLFLTETWLHESEKGNIEAVLNPLNYSIKHVPRSDDPNSFGGGVAVIFKNIFSSIHILPDFNSTDSFEIMALSFRVNNISFKTALVYRPGHPGTDISFLEQFESVLESFSNFEDNFYICGDFNYWINCPNGKPYTPNFINIIESHNCVNLINEPTHTAGNTLDLVICNKENKNIGEFVVYPIDKNISDHAFIKFKYCFPKNPAAVSKIIKFRNYKKTDIPKITSEFDTRLLSLNLTSHPIDLVNNYNTLLTDIHNINFPVIEKNIKVKDSNAWYDSSISNLRKQRRKAERQWRASGTEISRQVYVDARSSVITGVEIKKQNYFMQSIKGCNSNQKKLWNVICKLTGSPEYQFPSHSSADDINNFFISKIQKLRHEIDEITPNTNYSDTFLNYNANYQSSDFFEFHPVSNSDVLKLVNSMNKTCCSLDPFNFSKVPQVLSLLVPLFTSIINGCFSEGIFPDSEKIAIVRPLLKKPSLNKEDLKNLRPVSNLTFLSKLIEKAMLQQLNSHFNHNKCISDFQSAYRKNHSTETALCRIYNDLLHNIQDSKSSILIMLDLSSAFDTIDHNLLLSDLADTGIKNKALSLLKSYLEHRFQRVKVNDSLSSLNELHFGVPQGSVLGPVLFSLYSSKIATILEAHGINYHLYADDSQFYIPISNLDLSREKIASVLSDIRLCMHERKLKLNEGKTEVILINGGLNHPALQPKDINLGIDVLPKNTVKNLGVIFDSKLSFIDHFNSIVKTCNFHMRRLSSIIKYLDKASATTLMHAFITSRIDYCNSLFINLPNKYLKRLQTLLNRAARLIFNLPPFTRTSSYLYELHWLPIKARLEFKVCLLVYKALSSNQPAYIRELLTSYTPQCNMILRAADNPHLLVVPRLDKRSKFASRALSYAGPKLFNQLPSKVKDATTTDTFKKLLKTHLFTKAYDLESKNINIAYRLS